MMTDNYSTPTDSDARSTMEEMISQKKDSVSKRDAKLFSDAWLTFAVENGVTDDAVSLLFNGFRYAASEPFYRYMRDIKDKTGYVSFFTAKQTRENEAGIALRAALNLLALELAGPTSPSAAEDVGRKIPTLALNRERRTFGSLQQYVGKLLVKPLARKTISADIKMSPKTASALVSTLGDSLEHFGQSGSSSVDSKAAIELFAWLKTQAGDVPGKELDVVAEAPTTSQPEMPVPTDEDPAAFDGRGVGITDSGECQADGSSEANVPEAVSDGADAQESRKPAGEATKRKKVPGGIPQVIAFLQAFQGEYDELVKRCESLEEAKRSTEARCAQVERLLREAQQRQNEALNKLERLRQRHEELQGDLEAARSENKGLMDKLADAEGMLSAIDGRDARQASEAERKMAAQLKVERDDFLDAADLPMSVDLGENLRDQLGNVFKILAENGIEL